ncbi:MAG TPA: hypothetical protein DD473_04495 [Planctomycetaceae bacterium]|nr:hypothetical protein [Planctomycetaceae bacterium]
MSEEIKSKRKSGWHRLLHPKFAVPVVLLLVLIAAPFLYRSYRLSLISDPGEPFDVEAFIAEHTVPDEENALVPFRNAISLLKGTIPAQEISDTSDSLWKGTPTDKNTQIALDYVKDNELALQNWEKASHMAYLAEEQPSKINFLSFRESIFDTKYMARMVVIRAWIAAENGNDTEAAEWILCNRRTSRLVELNSNANSRIVGYLINYWTNKLMVKWLAQQKVSQVNLEQFLCDVKSIHEMVPPISDYFKMQYLIQLNSEKLLLENRNPPLAPTLSSSIMPWKLYFQGEPELLYRFYGHCIVNNLRFIDKPKFQRPKISFSKSGRQYVFETPVGSSLPPSQLTPAQIEDASQFSPLFNAHYDIESILNTFDLELMSHRLIETAIQLEIYRKANGEFPAKFDNLFDSPNEFPIDNFESTGASLKYVKEGSGHYRLWSVGQDGIDSGGVELSLSSETADFGIEMIRKP